VRQLIRFVAAALAVLIMAACGTDVPHKDSVEFDEDVVLSDRAPEQRFCFRVASDNGYFQLRSVSTLGAMAAPSLTLTAINTTPARIKSLQYQSQHDTSSSSDRIVNVLVDCAGRLPCLADFELLVTAKGLTTKAVEGSVSVSVFELGRYWDEEYYLSIEPL
jgi:hypothetical protein